MDYRIRGSHPDARERSSKRSKSGDIPFAYREHDYAHSTPRVEGHFVPQEELPALRNWLRDRARVADETIDIWSTELKDYRDLTFARLEVVVTSPTMIEVTARHVRQYTLFLSLSLLNLDREILIRTNGVTTFKGHVEKDLSLLLREARRNPGHVVAAKVTTSVPEDTP